MTLNMIKSVLKDAKLTSVVPIAASTGLADTLDRNGVYRNPPKVAVSGGAVSTITVGASREWVHHVIGLLDVAIHQLYHKEKAAQDTILKAASLLRQQIDPQGPQEVADGRGRLLAWQAQKVLNYIDAHLASRISVAELGELVQLSGAHFSRCFRRTFDKPPHAFVLRRRLELATRHMLETNAPLSDIALRCGFADQAHFCKQFRQAMGQTPAAWRRVRTSHDGSTYDLRLDA
jgi:AraC family transcriptional regulator